MENNYSHLTSAVIVTDWEKVLHSNSQFPNITGLNESIVISDEFSNYINPDSNWENIRETGHTIIEFYNLNGEKIFLDVTCIKSGSSWVLTFSQTDSVESQRARKRYEGFRRNHIDFFQFLPIGIYRTTIDGKVLRGNNALVKMLGFDNLEELKRDFRTIESYVDKSIRDKQLNKWKETKAFGKPFEFELKRKDGSTIWVRDEGQIEIDENNGTIISINGILIDVTAEHEVRELLWKIQNNLEDKVDEKNKKLSIAIDQQRIISKHLKTILDSIPDIAWLKDKDSRLIAANQAYADAAGLSSVEDGIGKTDFEIWPDEVAMIYKQDDLEVIETRKKIITEEPNIDSKGNRFWYEVIKLPVFNDQDEIIGTAGIARNITTRKGQQEELEILIAERTRDLEKTNEKLIEEIEEHKHLERELGESRNRFKELLDLYPGIVLIISRDGEVIDAQMGKGHRFAIDQSSIIGGSILDIPLDNVGTKNILGLEKIRKTIDTGKKQAMEFNFKFGEIVRSYYAEAVKRDDSSVAVFVRDITNLKNAHKKVEESEKKFRDFFNLSPDSMIIRAVDSDEIIDANEAMTQLLKIPAQEITGASLEELKEMVDVFPTENSLKRILKSSINTKNLEIELSDKDGNIQYSLYSSSEVYVDSKRCSLATFRDITQRRQNQTLLKQTNTFLDTIISTLHETIFVKDLEGRYTFYRWPKYEEQGLIQTEQFIGKRVEDFVNDENRIKLANRMFNRAIETGEPISYTTNQKFHQMNISEIMHITLSPMRDEKGNITSVVGVAVSMTEKLKAEERVRLSEERYRTLAEGIDSPIFVHNGKNFLYFNNAFATALGHPKEELEEMDIYTILQTSQIDRMKNQFRKRQSGELVSSKATIRVLTKSGEELIWEILISKTTFDLQDCSLISATDITDLKETQSKLEGSNEFLNSVVTSMYEVVWAKDLKGRYTYYRWPEREKIGFTAKWHIGEKVEDCVTEVDHINITNSMFNKVIETGQNVSYQTEVFIEDLDRTELLQVTLSPLKDSEDKITGIVGVGKSITKQYLAEEKAKYFEKRYTGIIEAIDDIIFEIRKDKIVFVSPSVERILGIHPERLIGKELSELGREWKATFPSIESIQGKIFEFEMTDKNNKTRYFDIRINRSGNSIFGVAREITRKKHLEQAKEKYHSSLMHELKNPLVLIQGYAEMLESQLTDSASEMMKIIIESVKREDRRLTELDTRSASQRTYNFTQVPADGIADRIEELKKLIPLFIQKYHGHQRGLFAYHLNENLKGIQLLIDTDSMIEVIENLVSNAIKYSPSDRIEIDFIARKADDNWVEMKFSDKGFGIPKDKINNIFKPFFRVEDENTKDIDGSGIGLANVKLHIEVNDGEIEVESEVGVGSTFTIRLPIHSIFEENKSSQE